MSEDSRHSDTAEEGITTNGSGEYPAPEELVEREGVERVDVTYEHDDPDHCEAGDAGRTVFGVLDDGELLVLEHVDDDVVLLPNGLVEEDGAHIAEGLEFMEVALGLEVEVDSVERVRVIDHEVDGEPGGQTAHVVVGASVVGGELDVHDDNWSGAWVSEIPGGEESGDAEADMALFLD